ncbi:thiamine/thiamine pyrophosphate ABC transporter permease ThiP [Psychromonas antarctica]|uniref:thiamine/thiamine pyrophosphate ABC transporter permease ThiP n=1 Tax=Psychromonas antarctica TaxID=67573 RepID=UPI001EE90417|nr:thiamine/thiamine pyrophosphate ABC transporter permease ThiP [Psychromonas antarctica]MCG6202618.1 thiamine/thiamine pyrophosphate ABC transporter permease ThiP [Psychromonas antarctica]
MSIKSKTFPGLVAAGLILAFVIAAISALLLQSPDLNLAFIWQDPYYRHVTAFSFYQSFLSTILSIGLAIPIAHSLSRRAFFGKKLLLDLFATTLVLPVLVGVFGLLSIYGNSGIIAQLLAMVDQKLPFSIYGLNGILLAHLFFNVPFATRLLLQSLQSIPVEHHKLSIHLGISHWNKFKLVEWPCLRQQLPHVCGLVFMLCFTSFATVMALGGGPKSTTIELAIYQAIKFDFDLQSGALLALWQMLLCGCIAIIIQRFSRPIPVGSGAVNYRFPLFNDSKFNRCWDAGWIAIALILVIPPLISIIINGINSKFIDVLTGAFFWDALKNSLIVAIFAASIALIAGLFILITSRSWRLLGLNFRADKLELIATIILVTPGLVISTGLFLLLRNITDIFSMAIVIVIAVNALMALPYVIKTLAQPMLHIAQQYDQLCASLGMVGFSRFYQVEWRAIRQPIVHAFSISFVLSMGDLSAIALFGSQDFRTLPLYLFQLLGSYQMESAAVVSLFLLVISVVIFMLVAKITINKQLINKGGRQK